MRAFKRLLIATLTILTVGFLLPARADMRVVTDSPSATVIELTPSDWSADTLETGVVYSPLGAAVDTRPGGRYTPYFQNLVGLPSNHPPRVVVEDISWGAVHPGLPPEGDNDEETLPVPVLEGQGPVVVSKPFLWRRHWVARVFVVPVREEAGGVRPLERIRFRLVYSSPETAVMTRSDRLADGALLNARTASRWVQPRPLVRKMSRATAGANAAWPSGTMLRFEIEKEGMYKITRSDLEGLGIDLSGVDPRSLRIYNNGGQPLPENPIASRDSSLRENAILVVGEEDGSFDASDYILFYGRAVNTWHPGQPPGEYHHYKYATTDYTNNPYTYTNTYWLNIPDDPGVHGKRMASLESDQAPTFSATAVRSRTFVDRDVRIFNDSEHPESGKRWFASELFANDRYSVNFEVHSPLEQAEAKMWVATKRLDGTTAEGVLEVNSVPIDTFNLIESRRSLPIPDGILHDGNNTFTLHLTKGHAFFDWFEVSYLRNPVASEGRIDFDALMDDGVAEVTLGNIESPWIFRVQPFDEVAYTRNNPFDIESHVTAPRRYIAVNEAEFMRPTNYQVTGIGGEGYPNGLRDPNLAADYIFIVHDDFYDTAARLESYVEDRDGTNVLRVKTSDIYKEFSWGLYDATALRDFLMYASTHWRTPPSAVLLIGDGDYDYRNIVSNNDKNWVPTYESGSMCRDDWYTTFVEGQPEMPVGRLTVQTRRGLDAYIDKLMAYQAPDNLGDWRSRMVLLADDEWQDIGPTLIDQKHMKDAEAFARHHAPDYMNIKKIYIGTYPTTYDPVTGGRRKPLATRDLLDNINKGTLLVSFIGHGNAHLWCHEDVFMDSRDGPLINSGSKMPIYIAATCSWGQFDRPENESHPEQLLVQPGGAIGVIAATRKTNAFTNYPFSLTFYNHLFDRVHNYSLGEALFYAKLLNPSGSNRYYQCLGETMFRPALPRLNVVAAHVDPDSLEALGQARVLGQVEDTTGTLLSGYDGESLVTVYDSSDSLTYVFTGPDGNPAGDTVYVMPGGTLFRGLVTTDAGEFDANFIVPRDVKYGSNAGRIHMYAFNQEADGVGAQNRVKISMTSANRDDQTPPEINIFFDHRNWRDGDMTSATPDLMVDVFDTSGVNLTGEIGHDIRAVVDGQTEYVLTDEFYYNRDSFTRGTAEKQLTGLKPGKHRVEVWAWDNANNFKRTEASFEVVQGEGDVVLENVLNWPNPFQEKTSFTFELSTDAEVTIRIFTASGRLVREIGPIHAIAGFNYPEGTDMRLRWNGRDRYGDPVANGVYLYRLKAKGASGKSDETIGKILRIR